LLLYEETNAVVCEIEDDVGSPLQLTFGGLQDATYHCSEGSEQEGAAANQTMDVLDKKMPHGANTESNGEQLYSLGNEPCKMAQQEARKFARLAHSAVGSLPSCICCS
jgi:hypothetical protein